MKVAITGVTGRLGGALARHHRALGNEVIGLDRATLDLNQPEGFEEMLEGVDFEALINPAAVTSLEVCEDGPDVAERTNAMAPGVLASICAARDVPFVHVSTDYVFDGEEPGERLESDPAEPISVYGRTKLAGEQAVLAAYPKAWVARVSWLFGPERPGFVEMVNERAANGEPLAAIDDKFSCPTFVDDAAEAFDHLMRLESGGVVHVCNPGPTSWHGIACEIVSLRGEKHEVATQKLAEMKGFRAPRPVHTAMGVSRLESLTGYTMRPWQEALKAYLAGMSE